MKKIKTEKTIADESDIKKTITSNLTANLHFPNIKQHFKQRFRILKNHIKQVTIQKLSSKKCKKKKKKKIVTKPNQNLVDQDYLSYKNQERKRQITCQQKFTNRFAQSLEHKKQEINLLRNRNISLFSERRVYSIPSLNEKTKQKKYSRCEEIIKKAKKRIAQVQQFQYFVQNDNNYDRSIKFNKDQTIENQFGIFPQNVHRA